MIHRHLDRNFERRLTFVEKALLRHVRKLGKAREQNVLSNGLSQKSTVLTEEKGQLLLDKVKYLIYLLQEKILIGDIFERDKRVTQILMAILKDANSVTTNYYRLIIEDDEETNTKWDKKRGRWRTKK